MTLTPDASVSGVGAVAANLTQARHAIEREFGPTTVLQEIGPRDVGYAPNAHDAALDRAGTHDYQRWLSHVHAAAACSHPVRLIGSVSTVDATTGEITATRATADMPDGVIYKACGNRRKAVCPACAEVYRADAYQLVLAGLRGGKGIPETVSTHPAVFLTATAPSFGTVHTRRTSKTGQPLPCRPRRKPQRCPHGIDIRCNYTHDETDPALGTPFCLDCYDHEHQVVWNSQVGELFRRTRIKLNRIIERHAKAHGDKGRVRVSYGKTAEMQRRGIIHFHAILRFDGIDPDHPDEILPPPAWATVFVLAHAIREAFDGTGFTTPAHKMNPAGWDITWGDQIDIRPVHLRGNDPINNQRILAEASATGRPQSLSTEAVAGYLAKYATKSTEDTGHISRRITAETIDLYNNPATHTGRLVAAAWKLGADPDPEYRRLRRWAHTLGYGGHFFTKSQRYTTTFGRLRKARVDWTRHRAADDDPLSVETTITITELTYEGAGWRTTGDALLANTAAAKAREHRRIAAQEIASFVS